MGPGVFADFNLIVNKFRSIWPKQKSCDTIRSEVREVTTSNYVVWGTPGLWSPSHNHNIQQVSDASLRRL